MSLDASKAKGGRFSGKSPAHLRRIAYAIKARGEKELAERLMVQANRQEKAPPAG